MLLGLLYLMTGAFVTVVIFAVLDHREEIEDLDWPDLLPEKARRRERDAGVADRGGAGAGRRHAGVGGSRLRRVK